MYKFFPVKGGDMGGGSKRRGTKVPIGGVSSFRFNNRLIENRLMSYLVHNHLPEENC